MATLPQRAPQAGDLVWVRSRQWLVEEVVQPPEGGSPQVSLACADDDAQGQTLTVFWDCELDRRILEEEGWAGLAGDRFDAPRTFAAFYNTLRWNCTTATNPDETLMRQTGQPDAVVRERLLNAAPADVEALRPQLEERAKALAEDALARLAERAKSRRRSLWKSFTGSASG